MIIFNIMLFLYFVFAFKTAVKLIFPILLMIGLTCNCLVFAFNKWKMPIYPLFTNKRERKSIKEISKSTIHKVVINKKEAKLLFLGDIFWGSIFRLHAFFSIGDIFIFIGVIIYLLSTFGVI